MQQDQPPVPTESAEMTAIPTRESVVARQEEIQDELRDLERYLEWYDAAPDSVKALLSPNGKPAELPEAKPEPAAEPPPRKKAAAKRRAKKPRPKPAASTPDGAAAARREQLRAYIREHGPCRPRDLRTALRYGDTNTDAVRLSGDLRKLLDAGSIEKGEDGYTAKGKRKKKAAAEKPTDPGFEKGSLEALVWDALDERPLTVLALAQKVKGHANDALAAVCFRPPVRYGRRST